MSDAPIEIEPLPERVRVLVTAFTYSGQMGVPVYGYATQLAHQMRDHPRLAELAFSYTTGYPTDRVRNATLVDAKRHGFHFVLMLDDDMIPDLLVGSDPQAKPFLPTALEFAWSHKVPCCVGAPYCSGPPDQSVVVMRCSEEHPDAPDATDGKVWRLRKYTRDEAAEKTGVGLVAALPTGCLLIDTRACDILEPPYFAYEWQDPPLNTLLASTEDVYFTRNCDHAGVKQYCAWDSWAGHVKPIVCGKPRVVPVDGLATSWRKSWERGWKLKNAESPNNNNLRQSQPSQGD